MAQLGGVGTAEAGPVDAHVTARVKPLEKEPGRGQESKETRRHAAETTGSRGRYWTRRKRGPEARVCGSGQAGVAGVSTTTHRG